MLLRNARLADGTGAALRSADVRVLNGMVLAVERPGELTTSNDETIDLDGLVLAPGFIDIHTHYDAQVTWDPDMTPSCWHGITTAVVGNCGFGIAPTRPEHRDVIARTLEVVEGMSYDALDRGIAWDFETFPEFMAFLEQTPKRMNVAAYLGHTPLRWFVMGDDAPRRAATENEITRMEGIAAEALASGALGFSSSTLRNHLGAGGLPVPSRLASSEELVTIASVFGDAEVGVIQATSGLPGSGMSVDELASLSKESRRPVTWTALLTVPGVAGAALEKLERMTAAGGDLWPQIACRPVVMQVTMADPFPFGRVAGFDEILALPREERASLYADPGWRDRVRGPLYTEWGDRWDKLTVEESSAHTHLINGPSMAELAAADGRNPVDILIDLALEENLETRFRIVVANDDEDEVGELLRDPRTILGLSDAGAHVSQLCDACYSTYLLGYWVRTMRALSLEDAVWRLTGQPARMLGLRDRGEVAPGKVADLVVFDPETIGPGPLQRVRDLPGAADRLISKAEGIEHVFVGGTQTVRSGQEVPGARPGRVLRPS